MKVAAVIPVYNEERTIREVVARAEKFTDKVIVVDDGSRDASAKEAMKTKAEVIVLPKNTGKANALREGFKHCRDCDIVIMLDGDLQHPPEEIPKLVECITKGSDLCIGSRFLRDPSNMPLSNKFSNAFARKLIRLLTGKKLTDPQSGYRAIRREKLEQLELKAERYAIEHIMILEAAKKGFKIGEVAIPCVYGEEKSKINPVRDTLRVAYYVARFVAGR